MFSTDAIMRRGAVALACTFGFGGAALAQTIVVSSAGPSSRSYPAGKSLAPGAKIALAAGDTLTVLDKRGTRTLRGPGNFGADASTVAANQSFASLVSTQNRRRARTGAVRGDVDIRPLSLWFVDIRHSATMCVVDATAIQLWRPKADEVQTLTLKDDATGQKSEITIPLGYNNVVWPVASMPVAEGRNYTLSGAGFGPSKIRFTMMGGGTADPAATYIALDTKGCAVQKKLLLDTMEPPKTPPAG